VTRLSLKQLQAKVSQLYQPKHLEGVFELGFLLLAGTVARSPNMSAALAAEISPAA
jgi:hypothetical protein